LTYDLRDQSLLSQLRSYSAVGSAEMVAQAISKFVEETGADELMLVSLIFDHRKKLRSIEMAAEAAR
jgi:alkanesulfonate monooxygenase SsuD/methylene tetrahydromethanopterin reductase-like flavin-dependent oxidoreductase (luciferase family)